MKFSYSSHLMAGTVLLVGLAQFIVLLQIAEFLYPDFSTSRNYISDLGATCRMPPGNCTVVQPSASIFNGSTIALGILIAISTYFLQKAFGQKVFSLFILFTGFGVTGVGLFPETTGIIHLAVAFVAFIFMGFAAITSHRIVRSPLNYFSVILGVLSLAAMVLFMTGNNLGLGVGGMERMIMYPVLIWGLAFAGFLINRFSKDMS
jgi:hypothetical membrane protein